MGKSDLRVFIGADASNFNKNIKAAQTQLLKFENVAKSVGSSIKTALVGAFAIDSAQRFFSTMIDAGRGFQDQMARVQAVSNASSKNFEMMRKEAARLGATTKYSASQAAAALENLVRNGLDARKATKALSSVLELAGANAIELAEAADIVTNTMNMFSLSVDELNRVNDVLSKTTASSATNLTDLYEALKYAAPTANLFGINIEEVNAALGVLANQGIKGSQAGTTLRSILNSLVKPTAEAAKVLGNLGIDEVSIKLDGLIGTLQKLQGLSNTDYATIFGKEFGGYAATLINSNDLTKQLKSTLDGSMGEAARMFQQGAGRFNTAIDSFKSAFEGAMIKIFDAVEPALTSAVNWFTHLVSAVTDARVAFSAFGATLANIGIRKYIDEFKKIKAENAEINATTDLLQSIRKGLSNKEVITEGENDVPVWINSISRYSDLINGATKATDSLKKAFKNIDSGQLKKVWKELDNVDKILQSIGDKPLDIFKYLVRGDEIDLEGLKQALNEYVNEVFTEGGKYFSEYFGDMDQAQAKKAANTYKKQFESALKSLNVKGVLNLATAFDLLNREVDKTPKKVRVIIGPFQNFWKTIKKGASDVLAFMGGWPGLILNAINIAIPVVVDGFRNLNKSIKDAKKTMADAAGQNHKLNYSFRTLVEELSKAEKGSLGWQTRLAILKRDYPDLVEELRKSGVVLDDVAKGFGDIAKSLDEVIKKQEKMNLVEAANAARDALNKAYLEGDYNWLEKLTKGGSAYKYQFEEAVDHAKTDDDVAAIETYFWEIGQIVTSTRKEAEKIAEIHRVLTSVKGLTDGYNINGVAKKIVENYQKKVGNAIGKIPNLKENLNDDTFVAEKITLDKFYSTLTKAFNQLEKKEKDATEEAKVRFPDDVTSQKNYIENQVRTLALTLVDELITAFKDIDIEGQLGQELLKKSAKFNAIRQKANVAGITSDTGGSTKSDPIADAEKAYKQELDTLADELKQKYITEEQYEEGKLNALKTIMNVYRSQGKVLSDVYADYIKQHRELADIIKKRKDSEDAMWKDMRETNARDEQIENDKGDFRNQLQEILGRKSGIDLYSDFLTKTEGGLNHLQGQLEDLKVLREQYLGKGFDKEVNVLTGAITKLEEKVKDLDKAFNAERLKEFRKELNDLSMNTGVAAYDTFIGLGNAFITVKNALDTFGDLSEIEDGWERFVAGFQAFISITDTMVNTVLGIRDLAEMFKELTKQKEIYNAVKTGAQAADIAAIEGEAAAVVAAEATKSAAIETAAVANIAAKVAQAQAAQILMAAESTAAYAAIPFAGPALAAAAIAEMKALILAAAALPAFANGGIVGGNSYIGDKVLARVNSGEMILNQKQQKNLFSMLNNGSVNGGGQVKFKIEGKELVGVLKNYNNIKGKVQ